MGSGRRTRPWFTPPSTYGSSRPTAITWTARVEHPGVPEDRAERNAGPARDADRTETPLRAGQLVTLLVGEEPAAVPGALEGALAGHAGERLQLRQGVRRLPAHAVAGHQQPPGRGVDDGRAGVVADEEPVGGRQVRDLALPHGFQVGAVVDEVVPHGPPEAISQHALIILNDYS